LQAKKTPRRHETGVAAIEARIKARAGTFGGIFLAHSAA
jgi:hypothetical protein